MEEETLKTSTILQPNTYDVLNTYFIKSILHVWCVITSSSGRTSCYLSKTITQPTKIQERHKNRTWCLSEHPTDPNHNWKQTANIYSHNTIKHKIAVAVQRQNTLLYYIYIKILIMLFKVLNTQNN